MKKFILLIAMLMSLGLQAQGCPRYDKAIDVGAEAISLALQCKNYREIRKDLDALGRGLGFCSIRQKGPIGNIVCPPIGSYAASKAAEQLPARWLCDPQIAEKVVEIMVTKTCKKIIRQ